MMPHSLRLWLVSWGAPVIWMALIFVGSSIPGRDADMMTRQASGIEEPIRIQRIKDAVHIIEYGMLAILLARAFTRRTRRLSTRHACMSFAIAVLYGISDEVHQFFVPLRAPGMDDVLRNTTGAGLAMVFVVCLDRWKRKREMGEEMEKVERQ